MKRLTLIGLGLSVVLVAGTGRFEATKVPGLKITTHTLILEEEKIWIHVYESGRPGLSFVNLHDNESTSAEAARRHIVDHGGRLVELRHGRGREVVIRRDARKDRFDPNRMFTDAGLARSLDYFKANTADNHRLGRTFAQQVLAILDISPGDTIIAMHNNTHGRLTIHDYKKGAMYGPNVASVVTNPMLDADDYYYTTNPEVFNNLAEAGQNVALMEKNPPIDVGSLAYYSRIMNITYVLVEAQHGHLERQQEMLETLNWVLRH